MTNEEFIKAQKEAVDKVLEARAFLRKAVVDSIDKEKVDAAMDEALEKAFAEIDEAYPSPEYDEDGNIIGGYEYIYDKDGNIIDKREYQFDENGKLIEEPSGSSPDDPTDLGGGGKAEKTEEEYVLGYLGGYGKGEPDEVSELNSALTKEANGKAKNIRDELALDREVFHSLQEKFGMSLFRKAAPKLEVYEVGLAQKVRENCFAVEDILRMKDTSVQYVLRECDQLLLAFALKAMDTRMADKIYSNMSRSAAEMMKEDVEYMGDIPKHKALESQEKIAGIIARLDAEGKIEFEDAEETNVADGVLKKRAFIRKAFLESLDEDDRAEAEKILGSYGSAGAQEREQAEKAAGERQEAFLHEFRRERVLHESFLPAQKVDMKKFLEQVRGYDEELCAELSAEYGHFDRLCDFDDRTMQKILREADESVLAVAMVGADKELVKKVEQNMSRQDRFMLRKKVEKAAAIASPKAVARARLRINNVVTKLVDWGEIVLPNSDDEEMI